MQFSNTSFQKSVKSQKSIYSCNVYQIDREERKGFNEIYNFKSNSVNSLIKNSSNSKNSLHDDKRKIKSLNIPRECGTQTSKTILELAHIESESMSPDSLTPSPRQNYVIDNNEIMGDSYPEIFSTTNSYILNKKHSSSTDTTINEELLQEFDGNNEVDSCESLVNSEKNCYLNHPENSLTKTFLSKTRRRNSDSSSAYLEAYKTDYLYKEITAVSADKVESIKHINNNKFFVDVLNHHPNYIHSCEEVNIASNTEQKIITNIRRNDEEGGRGEGEGNNLIINETNKPLDNTCLYGNVSPLKLSTENFVMNSTKLTPKLWCRSPKNNSFMLSTTASENKNQMPQIESIKRLISPTKRGRSLSPKIYCIEKIKSPRKIPYIDQSETNCSSVTSIIRPYSNGNLHSPINKAKGNFRKRSPSVGDPLKVMKSSEDSLFQDGIYSDSASFDSMMFLEVSKLRDTDWNESLRGLASIIELCRITDTNMVFPYMRTVNQRLIELLKSPRSYVCRTACQAAGHLFEYVKDTRRPEFDDIVDLLLIKTADSNKFIRHDANLALDCMVTHIASNHAIRTLCSKGPLHKNPLVRAATARLMICTIVITGPNIILHANNNEFTRKRIFVNMAKFLDDKNLETRKYGERMYKVLRREPTFDLYLKKFVGRDQITRIKKMLSYVQKK